MTRKTSNLKLTVTSGNSILMLLQPAGVSDSVSLSSSLHPEAQHCVTACSSAELAASSMAGHVGMLWPHMVGLHGPLVFQSLP